MNNSLPNESLIAHLGHHHDSFFRKDNDVVNIATIGHIFITTHARTDKSFGSIHIEFRITNNHFGRFNFIENSDFGLTLFSGAIVLFQSLEIVNRILDKMIQVILYLSYAIFQCINFLLRLIDIKL